MTVKERFVILARFFYEGFNPKLSYEVVVLDAILAVPSEKLETILNVDSLRHLAHAFVHACVGLKQGRKAEPTNALPKIIADWLNHWWEECGV